MLLVQIIIGVFMEVGGSVDKASMAPMYGRVIQLKRHVLNQEKQIIIKKSSMLIILNDPLDTALSYVRTARIISIAVYLLTIFKKF